MTAPSRPTVLVLLNAAHEPPGLLAPWLAEAGLALRLLRCWEEPTPSSVAEARALPAAAGGRLAALVVMGGPQSAYDDPVRREPDAPWLPAVKALLRDAVAESLPTLGVCLGGQLLAEACGGLVRPGDAGAELGARLVAKRDVAVRDPVFGGIPLLPDVVQWHWDEIAVLPPGAVLLAGSSAYANQAFRVGAAAYGLQFHIETTPDMVRAWAEHDAAHLGAPGEPGAVDVERLLAGVSDVQEQLAETWRPVVARFAALAMDGARP